MWVGCDRTVICECGEDVESTEWPPTLGGTRGDQRSQQEEVMFHPLKRVPDRRHSYER